MKTEQSKRQLTETLIEYGLITTCLNCDQWNVEKSLCDQFLVVPPIEVIVKSCESWQQKIPF